MSDRQPSSTEELEQRVRAAEERAAKLELEGRERHRQADERAARLARANAALRTILASLHKADDVEELLGLTLRLLYQHLTALAGLAFVAEPDGTLRCLWFIVDDRLVRGAESDHPLGRRVVAAEDHALWSGAGRCEPAPIVLAREHPGRGDDERAFLREHGIEATVSVPIVLGTELVAVLRFGVTSSGLPNDDLELLQALANQASIAFKLARLAKEARTAAVVEERTRLAREIHDTIAQGLAVIIRQLDRATGHPEQAAEPVAIASRVARESLIEARRAIRALRPPSLEGRTLDVALRDAVQRSAAVTSGALRTHVAGERTPLPSDVEDELFRIANEALTNAIKHAAARAIDVDVAFDGLGVRVGVRDDGVGFDPATTPRGVGLSSMCERAQRIGAAVTVASEPGTGTEVLVYWAIPPTG